MTPKALATQVRNLVSLLLESEIATAINPVVEQHPRQRTRITWGTTLTSAVLLSASTFATVDEYRDFISSQMYSAVLFDGALLQISYDFEGHDLVGHRLCYYPCPFDVDPEWLRTDPLADVIDMYRENSKSRINLRSPCRFDYDEQNSGSDHPAVHMHLITPGCRWAVSRPLSVGDFVRFVFRHFYSDIWTVQPFLQKWPRPEMGRRTIAGVEELELHINCGRAGA
jgi:hypothetical protein